jgi:uncharacterized membrane protein
MAQKGNFWTGFGVGVGFGAGLLLLPQLLGRAGASRIVRLEKSVQIGRPVDEVFNAWADWERLPRVSDNIVDIRYSGDRSHWRVVVGGQIVEWDAITEQWIPNQAIGWKSVNGPKHTGRVTFSALGDDTLVHVAMNYAPPVRALRPFVATMTGHMEGLIEKVLRDFKASVESRPRGIYRKGNAAGPMSSMSQEARTGTFGDTSARSELGFRGSVNPVEYTAPPEAKR